MLASVNSGTIYVSTNSGSVWKSSLSETNEGFHPACSADGSELIAAGFGSGNNGIYILQILHPENIIWTNTAGGNWSDTNNWSPNQTPGSGDVAVITNDASYTVTLDISPTLGGLVLGAPGGANIQIFQLNDQTLTLDGTALVSTNGLFDLNGGYLIGNNAVLSGAATCAGVTLTGTLTVTSNGVLNLVAPGLFLDTFSGSGILTNYGTINWGGGNINCNNGPVIDNYGLWDAQADATIFGRQSSGNAVINNYGTFRKSAGTGISAMDVNTTFNTLGMVDVQSGAVQVQGGGVGLGVLNIAGSASASFGARFLFTGGTLFTGAGTVGGTLIGSNAVFSGTLNCAGVTLSGTLTVASNSVLNLGALDVTFNSYLAGIGILTNYGTINWGVGNIDCDNSPVIDNYGLWNAQANSSLFGRQSSGSAVINNYGTFRKSAGTGISAMDANTTFNSSGTVDVQSGAVQAQGGGGGGGVLNVADNASASFGNRYLFTGGTLFTGAGTVGGFLIGSNAVFSGTLNCAGVTLSGTLTVASNSVLNLGALDVGFNSNLAGIGILTNYGTINWGVGNIDCENSPVIDNYGLWNAQANSSLFGRQSSGNAVVNNYGTFLKSAGTGISVLDANSTFNTSGTVDVQTGAVQVQGGGSGGGVLNVADNASASFGTRYLFTGGTLFTGSGTVGGFLIASNAVFSGTLNCAGVTLSGTLTVASNSVLNLGALDVGFNSNLAGIGVLTNYGTINWGAGNIYCDNSPVIDNYGLWNAQANSSLFGRQSSGNTVVNNYGTFLKSAGTGISVVDANSTFNTSGTVDVQSGAVQVQGGGGSGVLNVAGSASASFGIRYLFTGSTLFTGGGAVGGFLIGSNAVFSGTLNCSGVTLSGTLTVASNSVLNLGALDVTFNSYLVGIGILTNYGTINWGIGNIDCDNSPVIDNYGLWNAQAGATLFGRQSSGNTVVNNYGTIRKFPGGGTTAFTANTIFTNSGTLDVQSGAFNFVGDCALAGGNVNFGINSSNNFGSINVASVVTLGGSISANLNNSYAPRSNATFAVLNYNGRAGTFSNYNLPAGFVWTTNYGNSTFSLIVGSIVPAQLTGAVTTQGGTNFTFSFGAVPGQIYQIQFTTSLAPANWINLGGPVQATTSSLTISDAINRNPQLFYRAVLLR